MLGQYELVQRLRAVRRCRRSRKPPLPVPVMLSVLSIDAETAGGNAALFWIIDHHQGYDEGYMLAFSIRRGHAGTNFMSSSPEHHFFSQRFTSSARKWIFHAALLYQAAERSNIFGALLSQLSKMDCAWESVTLTSSYSGRRKQAS